MSKTVCDERAYFNNKSDNPDELTTTVDQWREALAAIDKPKYPAGKTLVELAAETGLNRSTLKDRLTKMIREGRCVAYKDCRRGRHTTVYILEKTRWNRQ